MDLITLVTGPPRSGTSCVTGLLERCGFNLGQGVRILRQKTAYNPQGHFEPDLLFAINDRLLFEASHGEGNAFAHLLQDARSGEGDISCVPEEQALAELAAKRAQYFQLFVRKFDGELCKDPLMCLTLPFWQQHWPALRRVIFCLRHPLAVALSMAKRYGITVEQGLALWQTYVTRFFHGAKQCRVFVFDFDAFCVRPADTFAPLLDWLDRPMTHENIRRCLNDFFGSEHVHWSFDEAALHDIPLHISNLYLDLRSSHLHGFPTSSPSPSERAGGEAVQDTDQ